MHSRKRRILSSLILGPFTWLYTYRKDKFKLWIGFVISTLTFGLYYFFVAYPWSILNAIFRKKSSYEHNSIDLSKPVKHKGVRFLISIGTVVQAIVILGAIAIVAAWFASLSNYPQDIKSHINFRLIFWVVMWTTVLTLVLTSMLSKYKKDVLIRRLRIALHTLLIVAISVTIVAVSIASNNKNSTFCGNESEMLNKGLAAVLPVATDAGTGTAFAIDVNGSLLTAYHVVEDQDNIRIALTSGDVPARLIRSAPEYDLALLKVDMPTNVFLPLNTDYAIGDAVYAIGWPGNTFDAGKASATKGIVSRVLTNSDLKLTQENLQQELEIVQTDASINPGNSGGPLLNKCGVVGVVSSISDTNELSEYGFVSEQGIGYAISTKTIRDVLGVQ